MSSPKRKQTAKTTSIPAPVKGLNAKDSIAAMDPTFALVLDNYFCSPTTVDTRNGSTTWATGLDAAVETVMHYSGGATNKMYAATSTKIYDVTAAGAVGSAKVTSLTSARFQWVNFAAGGGTFLIAVNGADLLLNFDGTNWTKVDSGSTYAISGVTTSTLIHVNVFKNRLWFVEKNTLRMWYLPLQAIGGTANVYDLSSQFSKGGYLMAMMTWTIDNTSGVDDYAVFITSEGEVAIYQGYDPAFSSTFTLVGKFVMGRPVGRRCFTKMGSDDAVICADGVVTLSKELTTDRDLSSALSYNIQNLITTDVTSFANNFGWQPVYYPIGNKLIINVPSVENSVDYQYVMNTITGAWSTWNKENIGYTAYCWDTFEDAVYAGGNTVVYQCDTGEDDSGVAIASDCKPAFSYFGDLGQSKYFTMVRPIYVSDGTVTPSFALCLDYNDVQPTTPTLSSGGGPAWDSVYWDTSYWGGANIVNKDWRTVGGIGYAASLRMALLTQGIQAQLQSIDYVYEPGGVL